jgi:hypothetical protein
MRMRMRMRLYLTIYPPIPALKRPHSFFHKKTHPLNINVATVRKLFPFPSPSLPTKSHQPRIKRDRQQKMAATQHRQWKDRHKLRNVPTPRNEPSFRHNHHTGNHRQTYHDTILERFKHLRDLDEEVGELDFLCGGAP